MPTEPVPAAVESIVNDWTAGGRPAQPGIAWHPDRWIEKFPRHADVFAALPELLDRTAVARMRGDAVVSAEGAERFFLAVMAWGMGSNGYGPWRTNRILEETTGSTRRLHTVAKRLDADGPMVSYRLLGGSCRLKYLGPAFGTKFLHFLSNPASPDAAIVFDDLMAAWLKKNTNLSLNPLQWSPPTYSKYLRSMRQWAERLGISPAELESCIFRAEANARPGNQWGDHPSVP